MAQRINVAFSHGCVTDPWYSLGTADLLGVAQMTSQGAMRLCFDAVTENPAKILGLEGYGLEAGCHADIVLLQARDKVEEICLRATRLKVFRRGQLIAKTPAATSALRLQGRPESALMMIGAEISGIATYGAVFILG